MSLVVQHSPVITRGVFVTTTVSEIGVAPYANTKEIIFYNPSEDDRLFVRFCRPSEVAALTTVNAAIVPTGGSLSLAIGPEGEREPFLLSTNPSSQDQYTIYIQSETQVAPATHGIQYTYIQCRGDLG